MITFIEERLGELELEKTELTEYEQLDKNRRALEYTLYDAELSKATEKLSKLEVIEELQILATSDSVIKRKFSLP